MKKIVLFIIVLMIFTNCKNENKTEQTAKNQQVVSNGNFKIKNAEDYSADFVEGLKKQNLDEVVLEGNSLTIDGETIAFPKYPVFGKSTVLVGKKENLTITLTVNRINQTTINYNLTMMENGKGLKKFEGKANISPTFYLGAESDESSISKLMYFVDDYSVMEENCFISIRLGKEEAESGQKLLGKLIKNCNGEFADIDLDNFPNLVEE